MTKPQQQAAALAGLVVVMLLVWMQPWRRGTRAPASAAPAAAAPSSASPAAEEEASAELPPAAASDQREVQAARASGLIWNRDPFLRVGAEPDQQPVSLVLSGILWDPAAPLAILNGETVRVGDTVGGYRVTEIAQGHVSVSNGTETLQLSVTP